MSNHFIELRIKASQPLRIVELKIDTFVLREAFLIFELNCTISSAILFETERDRERQRETERDRERERQRETERAQSACN